jgi:hypothetical protein
MTGQRGVCALGSTNHKGASCRIDYFLGNDAEFVNPQDPLDLHKQAAEQAEIDPLEIKAIAMHGPLLGDPDQQQIKVLHALGHAPLCRSVKFRDLNIDEARDALQCVT